MPAIARLLPALTLSWCCGVQAATIELRLDVSGLSTWNEWYDGQSTRLTNDPAYGPTAFSMTVRFDLDSPLALGSNIDDRSLEGHSFTPAEVSQTFRSISAQDAGLPPPQASAAYLLPSTEGADAHLGVEAYTSRVTVTDDVQRAVSYARGISLNLSAPVVPASGEFDAGALIATLQAHVGETFVDGFHEGVSSRTQTLDGQRLSSSAWLNVGKVTLKSVSVVPEPGGMVLSAIGLSLAFVAARRRSR